MGIDVSNIAKVIQWGITLFTSLLSLWQRFGRAERRKGLNCCAIPFYPQSMIIQQGPPSGKMHDLLIGEE